MEIIDAVEVGIPGPAGTITPAAEAALASGVQARDDSRAARDQSRDARDQAQTYAATTVALQDATLKGLVENPSGQGRGAINTLLSPLELRTLRLKATDTLSALAVAEADYVADARIRDGVAVTRGQALYGDGLAARAAGSPAVISRAIPANLLPNLPMSGAALGVMNSGGLLPTGWGNANGGIPKEVLAFTADGFTLKIGPHSGGSFGGVRTPLMSPSEAVVVSFDIAPGNLPPLSEVPAFMNLAWDTGGTLSSLQPRTDWTWDSARRISVVMPQPPANSTLAFIFTPGNGAPAQSLIFTLSKVRVDLLSSVTNRVLDRPAYSTGAIAGSTERLVVDDGRYVVVFQTPDGTLVRRRHTVSGGNGLNLASVLVYLQVSRFWVIPEAYWTRTVAGLMLDAFSTWENPMVRYAENQSSAERVMRAFDRAQLSPSGGNKDVSAAAADGSKPYSVSFSRLLPGCMRFEVRPGDKTAEDGPTQERAETHVPDKLPYDTDIDIHDWVFFESYPVDTAQDPSTSVWQVRYTNDNNDNSALSPELTARAYTKAQNGYPALAAGYVRVYFITNSTTDPAATVNGPLIVRCWVDLQVGREHQIYARARFSRTGGGYLRVVVNGVELFNGAVAMGHNRVQGPQFRCGAYGNSHNNATRIIRHREVRYGTESLEALIGAPGPL